MSFLYKFINRQYIIDSMHINNFNNTNLLKDFTKTQRINSN